MHSYMQTRSGEDVSTRSSSLSGLLSGLTHPAIPLYHHSTTSVPLKGLSPIRSLHFLSSIMRFTTTVFASICLLASSISAQKSGSNDVDPSQLLAELAELPECAVSEWIPLLRLWLLIVDSTKLISSDSDHLHSDSSPSFAVRRPDKLRLPLLRRRIYHLQRAMHPGKLHNSRIVM
jgi:hypothetical protein